MRASDARKLSEISTRIDLPSVHVPSALSRERKAICNSRMNLLATRTKLTNSVRGRLRATAVVLPKRTPETCPIQPPMLGAAVGSARVHLHDEPKFAGYTTLGVAAPG